MFAALPIEFDIKGKVNFNHIERYWKEDISQQARRPFRILVKIISGVEYIAEFEDQAARDKVFSHMDRFITGKDKTPMFDAEEWV